MDEKAKLRDVMEGLSSAVSEKSLMSSDWAALIGRLERLYVDSRTLFSPWPALCAYRLAHILMRDAREEAELQRILTLLDEAGELAELGPRPLLLRVAVLHRLNMLSPDPDGQRQIEATLTRAATIETPHDAPDPDSRAAQVSQNVSANLIEQTAYLLGLPLPRNVFPDPNAHFFDRGGWYVLMRDFPLIEMPKALAQTFYDNCVKSFGPMLTFTVDQTRRIANSGGKDFGKGNVAMMIAAVCLHAHSQRPILDIHHSKQAAKSPNGSISTELGSTRTALRAAFPDLSPNGAHLIEGNPKLTGLRLSQKITYVGLVEKRMYGPV